MFCSSCEVYKENVISTNLEKKLQTKYDCNMGEITYYLPNITEEEDKIFHNEINKLRSCLVYELNKRKLFSAYIENENAQYEIIGNISSYDKGNESVRVFVSFVAGLIGSGIGAAKVTVRLELTEKDSKNILYSGEFYANVSDWDSNSSKMYRHIAKDFAKELEQQHKKLSGK
jgi:hypothetical protein